MSSSPQVPTTNLKIEGRQNRDGTSSGTTDATPDLANLTIRTPGRLAARATSVPQRTPTTQTTRTGAGPTSSGGAPRTANGLSASARRLRATSVTNTATPHARRAIEVFKGRRTAIFNTPGGRRKTLGANKRRASQGGPDPQKDGPFDALRHLSRRLAPQTQRVVTSSSPGDVSSVAGGAESSRRARDPSGIFIDEDDEDDVSGFIERRPRLSLPIDAGDDDEAELRPPRTSGLENIADDTVMSIEAPRRAISEQPYRRAGRDSLRMSDYFANGQDDFTVEVGQDFEDPIPPAFDADGDTVRLEDDTYERLDSPLGRQEALAAGRQSDFGTIEVPLGVDSPFRLEPVLQDSSDPAPLPPPDFDDYGDGSPAPQMNGDEDAMEYENVFAAAADAAGPGFGAVGDIDDFEDVDDETEMADDQPDDQVVTKSQSRTGKKKPGLKISKYGHQCPSLPAPVVKRLAETMARTSGIGNTKITPETLQALMQSTEWFFEQMGDDLRALAHHAGRKTIEQSDVITLMKRQRQIDPQTTLFSLAQRHLPRELLQELRMPARAPLKKRRKAAGHTTSFDET
ncbi:hypothetical protein PgNI_10669 [Pyricularia grisea]|uniref:CENP-T/Histone H4 histone fold domain-containing protein n=1 Tax=Pyricularia grisea TaxID=148305 RepID=A0A6P8AXW7_PYRGI|nr:hypothetical protein PgNI_10669 [Pyricularia grisea]TLD07182.1 hypothetical protein PgNI_10669 [Pyricularia grisea]